MESIEEQAAHRSAAAHGRLWEALNGTRRKARAAQGITEVAWMDRGVLRLIPWERFRAIGYGPGKSVVWTGSDIAIHQPQRGKR